MADNGDYQRRDRGMNPLVAGIIGVIIGAVTSATAIFFSRKENRDKVKQKAGELKSKGGQVVDQIKSKAREMKETTREKAGQAQEEAKKEANKPPRR